MNDDARRRGLHSDVYVGATLLVFCGIVYWNTTTFAEVSAMLSQNVPPTFFPRLILTVIAGLSAVLLIRGAKQERRGRETLSPVVALTAAVIGGAVALVPHLGMLATVALVAVVLPLCWGERRLVRIALLAVLLPLSIYLIFVVALGMRLPAGPLS